MTAVRFKDLCIDAVDPKVEAEFWARALGLQVQSRRNNWWLTGPSSEHTIWLNKVPEPKTVKNRVHWDVYADPDELLAAGATMLKPRSGKVDWHVMADPEGNEFCVFAAS